MLYKDFSFKVLSFKVLSFKVFSFKVKYKEWNYQPHIPMKFWQISLTYSSYVRYKLRFNLITWKKGLMITLITSICNPVFFLFVKKNLHVPWFGFFLHALITLSIRKESFIQTRLNCYRKFHLIIIAYLFFFSNKFYVSF